MADLSPAQAGAAVGAAWANLGHQVAVVPLGIGGQGLREAVNGLPKVTVLTPGRGESSSSLAQELLAARDADTILVDLAGDCCTDAGAGLLESLGGRGAVLGGSIIGIVREDEAGAELLGVRGVAARRSYASGAPDVAIALAQDAVLRRFAADLGMPDPPPGAGAGNGLALAILALGGVVRTGPQAIGELVGIDRSLESVDLIVGVVDEFDFGGAGIAEAHAVAVWAQRAAAPCIMIASRTSISTRELRTHGVEAAYELGDDVEIEAARIARTWSW